MTKVLVATDKPFAAIAVKGIREVVEGAGYELALLEKYTDKSQLLDAVKDANAVIIRSDIIDAPVLEAAKELKIVVRAGAGYDNVDLAAATAHNVCVMNTPGQNSNAVAELVFGMLVYAVRNFYNGTSGTELKGKKLGILAYGNVGRNVARIAKGFGMDVYAFDAFCPAEVIEKDGVKAVASTADLFKSCQIVSLHIPATAETKGSINFELMNSMPKGAIVVNTARKEVIDEAGLAKMMEERPVLNISQISSRLSMRIWLLNIRTVISGHRRRWEHRQLRRISMPVLLQQNRSSIFCRTVTRNSESINKLSIVNCKTMAKIKPFKGIRPPKDLIKEVASRPYDVLNSEEAREEALGNEKSLYHIIKPEIDFPVGTDEHDPAVYEKAAENFQKFQDKGWLIQDQKEQ